MKKKLRKDWWLVNGLFNIIEGIIFILTHARAELFFTTLILGSINIIIGIALLKRSKLVFWLVFSLASLDFILVLTKLGSSQVSKIMITLISFISALMLLVQIIKEEKLNKLKN